MKYQNLYQYLLENIQPEQTAVIANGTETSYGELLERAEGVAQALKALGVSFQEPVGILAENSTFWIACYLGILKIGAIATPFPSRLLIDDLSKFAQIIQCNTFCVDEHFSRYVRIIPSNSRIVIDRREFTEKANLPYQIAEPNGSCETVAVKPKVDIAALMFTSGSTGQPNAVKVSHQNIIANTNSICTYLDLSSKDRMMTVLPFHYCFGTSLLHTHLRVGASLVINNSIQYVEDVLNEMETFACTGIAGVPSIFQNLLKNSSFPRRRFPNLRHVQQAGGKLADAYIKELLNVLSPETRLFIMYGQTEATARLSYLPPERLSDKLGSIGRGLPGVTLKILDSSDEPVKPGNIGEIVAEGENITLGYWIPDPNKNPFRNGKLYTGDLAYADEEGFIYIVGRASDFIKPNGHRISAATIETILLEIPEIVEVAVIGIPHASMGEAAKAYIVVRNGANCSDEQIFHHCKKRLPAYAVPQEVTFLQSLPKNSAGKILKTELK